MTDFERLKLSAAIWIAPMHRDLTPRSAKPGTPPAERVTWRQWWEKRFNDDYARYTRENFQHFKPKQEPAT